MFLKRLDIQGFKSFAVKTSMEFEPGITAVVGPNGSGKSNVADSVRWVLGEQSTKLLRGKKSDDVVFAGSDKRPRSGFAEVVATFDNADHIIPVDSSEVSIGRRIDRSGESEYLINGQKVRLMDIVDLVLKSNIGTSRYTVIGQGTIDMLIMSGPGEIKGLLDEASGVKVYQIRREKTLRRLEHTAQNLIRVEDVVAELEPRLKSLRRQAKRMEAREEHELELRVLLREFWGGKYFEFTRKLQGFSEELTTLQQQLQKFIQQQEVLESRREVLLDRETGVGGKFSDIRNTISTLSEEKNSLQEKKSILRAKLSSGSVGEGNPELIALELSEAEGRLRRLTEQLNNDKKQLEDALKDEQRISQKLRDISSQVDKLYDDLSSKQPLNQGSLVDSLNEIEQQTQDFLNKLSDEQDQEGLKKITMDFASRISKLKDKVLAFFGAGETGGEQVTQVELKDLLKVKQDLETEARVVVAKKSGLEVSLQVARQQSRELEQKVLDLKLELGRVSNTSTEHYATELGKEQELLDKRIAELNSEIAKQELLLAGFDEEAKTRRDGLVKLDQELRAIESEQRTLRDKISTLQIENAKVETEKQVLDREVVEFFGESELGSIMGDAKASSTPDLEARIAKIKSSLEQIGSVDEMTMQEYRETEERFSKLSGQVDDLKKGMEDLRQVMDELDEHIHSQFNTAFHKVNEHFEKYFRILFSGGKANLSLVKEQSSVETEDGVEVEDEVRPEEKILSKYSHEKNIITGVEIKATPPGKKLASVQALSGGERALTAIALLCSLLACFPSPFVVLDEVDAALDEANTIRFGQILGSLAHQTQFLTITHNRETMAQSKILYGVTMGDDGVSKILSIKLEKATEYAK